MPRARTAAPSMVGQGAGSEVLSLRCVSAGRCLPGAGELVVLASHFMRGCARLQTHQHDASERTPRPKGRTHEQTPRWEVTSWDYSSVLLPFWPTRPTLADCEHINASLSFLIIGRRPGRFTLTCKKVRRASTSLASRPGEPTAPASAYVHRTESAIVVTQHSPRTHLLAYRAKSSAASAKARIIKVW